MEEILVQALLDAPMFGTHWRWNTTIALAIARSRGGRKTPPQIQRMQSEDLLAAAFPDAAACLENIPGDREIPDHPLVRQTIDDCVHEIMDLDLLTGLLRRIHAGEINYIARDLPEPSPLAHEILNARPYAFLDDAPLEERRTQAVYTRRAFEPSSADDLGALDPAAIERVRDEAWPDVRDADELHDALLTSGFLTEIEGISGRDGPVLDRPLAGTAGGGTGGPGHPGRRPGPVGRHRAAGGGKRGGGAGGQRASSRGRDPGASSWKTGNNRANDGSAARGQPQRR